MSKIICAGDIHGRTMWRDIVDSQEWDEFIFIGDYFDTFEDISAVEQIHNFKEIIKFKKGNDRQVILLIGNHDGYIYPELNQWITSGYQKGVAPNITQVLYENRDYLQMAYSYNNLLFSHAGISETWLELNKYEGNNNAADIAEFVNELWKYKPIQFAFNGREPTGDNVYQTPIWIRPRSLMADCQILKKKLIQIVGHTQQNQIDIKGKSTGGRYYFIDTLGTSKEYLIIENGIFTTQNAEEK